MYGGTPDTMQIVVAVIAIALLVVIGLISMQAFLFAKVGGNSLASFGAGAGATVLPGRGGGVYNNSLNRERFRR